MINYRSCSRLCLNASILAGLMFLATPKTSHAALEDVFKPSSRAMFAVFGLGPAINLTGSATQFKLTQEVGWHPFGTDGLAIGGALQEGVGSGVFSFQIGPKIWYDIAIANLALYLTPFLQMGYGLSSFSGGGFGFGGFGASATNHYFNFQFGVEGRAIINDRVMVFARMFTIDLGGGSNFAARYDMLFGAGFTFDQ